MTSRQHPASASFVHRLLACVTVGAWQRRRARSRGLPCRRLEADRPLP